MYMTVLPLAEVRMHLSQIVDEASSTHERVTVTRNGRPAAVLLGTDDYEALMETLDILADSSLVAAITEADHEMAAGDWADEAEVREAMRQAGRPQPAV